MLKDTVNPGNTFCQKIEILFNCITGTINNNKSQESINSHVHVVYELLKDIYLENISRNQMAPFWVGLCFVGEKPNRPKYRSFGYKGCSIMYVFAYTDLQNIYIYIIYSVYIHIKYNHNTGLEANSINSY